MQDCILKPARYKAAQWTGSNVQEIKDVLGYYWNVIFQEDPVEQDGTLVLVYDGAVRVYIPANSWVVVGPIFGGRAESSLTLSPEEYDGKFQPDA